MFFGVVTLFPDMIQATLQQGVVGRALQSGLINLQTWNPRDYTHDVHRTVDDRPYGGGPGMIMKVEPLVAALQDGQKSLPNGVRRIYLSPQGIPVRQAMLREVAQEQGMLLVCGRYEGIDERIIQCEIDEEWSLGDFVLSGGEIAAAAVIDGVARLIPGVLGHSESAVLDSFENGWLDCPHYTRPESYKGKAVPPVLLSGNHEKIRRWRLEESIRRTLQRRPDLVNNRDLSEEEKEILEQLDHTD